MRSGKVSRPSLGGARVAWLLSLPALAIFVAVVIVPLAMTALLSFHDWGQYKGIEPVLILKNWREVLTDPYFREMFVRTFRIALLVTLITALLGAPEAYILNRMRSPWRGIFLLVILGPCSFRWWHARWAGHCCLAEAAASSTGL